MRLERVEISGFCHFTEPLILDLRETTGLVAIVGPNGAGKTTGLDAALACLYGPGVQTKAFPSRDGTLFTYATARDAYIDTLWYLEGRGRVRCRVNVDGPKRKAEAVLEEIGPDGIGHPVNNGQTATYRDAVAERFPSLRSLLASAYAAQNRRGGFGELGQKERMELFVELADLAHLEEKSATARRCAQIGESVAARIRSALDVLSRDATSELLSQLRDELCGRDGDINDARDLHRDEEVRIAELTDEAASLSAEAHLHTAARVRRDELGYAVAQARVALERHDTDAAGITSRCQSEIARALAQRDATLAAIKRRRETATTTHQTSQTERGERIANNRKVLADAAQIRAADARVNAIVVILDAANEKLHDLQDDIAAARSEARTASEKLAAAQSASKELTSAQQRAGLLSRVKFGDDCGVDPVCPLVADAVAAKARIEELTAAVTSGRHHGDVLRQSDERAAILSRELIAESETVAALMTEKKSLTSRAALVAHLAVAEERIAELERDVASADRTHAETLRAMDTEVADAVAVQVAADTAAKASAQQQKTDAAARRITLTAAEALAQHELQQAEQDVASRAGISERQALVESQLRAARSLHAELAGRLVRLETERTGLIGRIEDVERRLAQSEELVGRLRTVEDEMLAWQTLARACGRDGLQRLEIDAAGPVVSDLANQLLRVGYGTRFSVEIVTQVATAKGDDVKEKFTILAIDNEHGGESRDIGDLSGGERVIVEEAVRAALSCYVNIRSRQPSRTIWRDETTGALDPENASRYVAMLRKLQELSGAQQVLFITHSPACAALADAQLRVRAGTADMVLPPYSEEAA